MTDHIALANCEECPLKPYRKPVPGFGKPAPLVFVAEAPGREEATKGRPLVGQAGQLWRKTLARHGIDPDKCYATNTVSCRPPGNATPTPKAIECCKPRLESELKAHTLDGSIIVPMGNTALHALTGDSTLKITAARGRARKGKSLTMLPTLHPSAMTYPGGQVLFKDFDKDIAYAIELAKGQVREPIPVTYQVPETYEQAIIACKNLKRVAIKQKLRLSADVETTGFDRQHDRILELGIAFSPSKAVVFKGEFLVRTQLNQLLHGLFESNKVEWIGQNFKFDAAFLRRKGIRARVDHDTMLLSYCLREGQGGHGLKGLSEELLGAEEYDKELRSYLPNKKTSFEVVPPKVRYKYLAHDCCYTRQVFDILYPKVMADSDLKKLYEDTLIPSSNFLLDVEHAGIKVDMEYLSKLEVQYTKEFADIKGRLQDLLLDAHFNPNSPKQVGDVIYNQFRLRPPRGHKATTRAEVLEKLQMTTTGRAKQFIDEMVRVRKVNTRLTRGLRGISKFVKEDGRVRSTYLQHGTVTGRLSSREPNLQNIERGEEMRNIFCAPEGFTLVEADYSQAELRVLAHESGDEVLKQIYRDGRDLHGEVVRDIISKFRPNMDPDEQRIRAKFLNFGIVYGRTAYSLKMEFGCSEKEAQGWIDGWFSKFSRAHEFMEEQEQLALNGKPLVTPFGRKRRFGLVTGANVKDVKNEAKNFKPQSEASDLTLRSAMLIAPKLLKGVRIVNLVHDSILFEVPNELPVVADTIALATNTMKTFAEQYLKTDFPFAADAKIGTHWGSTSKYNPEFSDE